MILSVSGLNVVKLKRRQMLQQSPARTCPQSDQHAQFSSQSESSTPHNHFCQCRPIKALGGGTVCFISSFCQRPNSLFTPTVNQRIFKINHYWNCWSFQGSIKIFFSFSFKVQCLLHKVATLHSVCVDVTFMYRMSICTTCQSESFLCYLCAQPSAVPAVSHHLSVGS